jgi:hypothetical protein
MFSISLKKATMRNNLCKFSLHATISRMCIGVDERERLLVEESKKKHN